MGRYVWWSGTNCYSFGGDILEKIGIVKEN